MATLRLRGYIVVLCLLLSGSAFGQLPESNLRTKTLRITADTTQLDTLSISPGSYELTVGNQTADTSAYEIDPVHALLIWPAPRPTDSITITYRVLPFNFSEPRQNKDVGMMEPDNAGNVNPFSWSPGKGGVDDPFQTQGLNKSGSISRGIAFGNNQDLSVNSNLQLELSGQLNDNVKILASVTDDNIPIQPEGNTQQLQDFDQVFIQLYDDKTTLRAGDFQMRSDQSHYLRFFKKAQGASVTSQWQRPQRVPDELIVIPAIDFSATASLAASRGKFARNIVQGVEGNQGPYRLTGAEGETFIIILSGTERVFIDGLLLTRGQDHDYVINYNTSEIVFTSNQLITKDKRIIVEFQYSDKNYARFLGHAGFGMKRKGLRLSFNLYNEFDSKNQPVQLTLDDEDRLLLSSVGDSLNDAIIPAFDTTEFNNEFVLYNLIDTLGYDSVFVYTTTEDTTVYQVGFTQVGQGNGDYILSDFVAAGRIYEWIKPDTAVNGVITRNGEYAPVRRLVTPKNLVVASLDGDMAVGRYGKVGFEVAVSNYDLNTFSALDQQDNTGLAGKLWYQRAAPLSADKDPWKVTTEAEAEIVQDNFEAVERFRTVEFERNWNVLGRRLSGDQLGAIAGVGLTRKQNGYLRYNFNAFTSGQVYEGYRHNLTTDLRKQGWRVIGQGSFLTSEGFGATQFLRHKLNLRKNLGPLVLGFKDEHEYNRFYDATVTDSLTARSYRFYDWEVSVGNSDSAKNHYSAFYRQRTDWALFDQTLTRSTFAEWYGGRFELVKNRNSQLRGNVAYRRLNIVDTTLTTQAPDNTLVSRLDYNLRLFKGAVSSSTFYELGTGLEQRKEFVYVLVPAGQGVYAWIDYNGNNVKELNEFEIAAFPDQAEYIRVFTPSNIYVKTFSNQFNQVLNLRPDRIWKKKKGLRKYLSKLSTQTSLRVDRKTNDEDGLNAYNPFITDISDEDLLNLNSAWRHITWFHRNHSKWGVTHTWQQTDGKTLLNGGFDSRSNQYHEVRVRWNLTQKFTFTNQTQQGNRANASDFLSGRTYDIRYLENALRVAWQPSPTLRVSLSGTYTEKKNDDDFGGEKSIIRDFGTEWRYSVAKKGSLLFNFNFINITYSGLNSTALAFEMLDALQPGLNYTWSASWQRKLSKNMQLSLNYNGRAAEDSNTVHTGGMSVRAFF